MPNSEIISFIDWDFLNVPVCINRIVDNINLPIGAKKIILERDDNYNLKGTLKFQDLRFSHKNDVVAGNFHKGFNIEGVSDDGSILYVMESCVVGGITFGGASDFAGTADLRFNMLKVKCSEYGQSHLTEWYVNGPNQLLFGSVEGKVLRYYTREQFLSIRKEMDPTNNQLQSSFSSQIIWGKHEDFRFLILKIPSLGPEWSENVAIEYREEWGRIPKPNERLKIEELCSFVFGKHLLSVGHTAYDKDENIVEVYAHSPWGHDAKVFCSQPEYPPIKIHDYPMGDAEKIINYLLPKYVELSEPLCLTEALWNYWISFDVPIGANLPIIVSAIETIIHPWYKWKKTKSHGEYLEKNEFVNLIQEEIDHISKKLSAKLDIINKPEQKKFYEKIMNNISLASQFTFTDRFFEFFKEVGLSFSEREVKAINERHVFVHGHARFNEVDWEEVIRRANTLQTIFNKTMLKILEYKWDYIDRSAEGWPSARLT